ncbi:MAG: polysaccharide biosynthesis/export family protein [Flavobacteriales bacterium]|nr:polysaccharide biosynthesis/export family protein [Flavobacteriales bacterium]
MPKFISRIIAFFSILYFTGSCISNSSLVYLQNLENNKELTDDQLITYETPEYKLQYNDIVSIDIKTTVDFINAAFQIERPNQMNGGMAIQGGGDVYYMTGYTVDKEGNIELPLLGKISVAGTSLDETKNKIQESLKKLVNEDIFVRVKLGGIRYSIFGEVNRPGKFTILQDRITIFEALSNAGDFTTFAKRNEVIILRQYPNGTKIHRVNLLDRSIIQTPYYFIQTNDQIYAEPLKQREFARTENASQNILLVSSVLTTLLLIFNFLK